MLQINPADIRLNIGGRRMDGATAINLRRGLYETASHLAIDAPAADKIAARWINLAGETITLAANNNRLFTGKIDEVAAQFSTTPDTADQSVNINARSLTAILIDCTIPHEITDAPQTDQALLTIAQWANRICKLFGIDADAKTKTNPIETGIDPTPESTANEFLRDLAARRLAFINDTPEGKLLVRDAESISNFNKAAQFTIDQNQHLTEASASASTINRYNIIAIRYDNNDNAEGGEVVYNANTLPPRKLLAKPTAAERARIGHRRNVIVAKNQMKPEDADRLAQWHTMRQYNDFAFAGRFASGLWLEPGSAVNLYAPAIGIYAGNVADKQGAKVIITECELSITGEGGATSSFVAVPPAAIIPPPAEKVSANDLQP